jgi:hypothetical protein
MKRRHIIRPLFQQILFCSLNLKEGSNLTNYQLTLPVGTYKLYIKFFSSSSLLAQQIFIGDISLTEGPCSANFGTYHNITIAFLASCPVYNLYL